MKSYAMTDIGMHRKMNQDFYYASEQPVGNLPNLFIVADGMGGHNAGEYASRHAVDTMVANAKNSLHIQPMAILQDAIAEANQELLREASRNASMWGMGTTVVAAVIEDDRLYIANVGDSRLYIVSDTIRQVTKDHSLVEELVRRGEISREDARTHPDKNIITRAVGAVKEIEIDFFEEEIKPGDRMLLCSDGLTNMIEDQNMHMMIDGQRDIAKAVERLIETANQNGGKDNITAVLIDPFSE